MKARAILLAVILLGVGFGVGWYVRGPAASPPAPPSAGEALEQLMAYRGSGAPAARRVIRWVEAISEGGEEMLPRLDEALEEAGYRRFSSGTWLADNARGVVSSHPTLRSALAEAVARIGGDRAVGILMREAERPAAGDAGWVDPYLAFFFLARLADREDVREFLEESVIDRVRRHRDDTELRMRIEIAAEHLSEDAWPVLAGAFADGWPKRPTMDVLAEALFLIDRERAGRLFLKTLTDPAATGGSRAAATRAVARIPERREEALPIVLAHSDRSLLGWFLGGMSAGRFREDQRERAARESMDLQRMLEYTEGRVADLDAQLALLGRIRASIDDETAEALRFEEWGAKFEGVRDYGLETLEALKEAIRNRENA